jgi:ceramide glucosyltransferase
MMMRHEFWLMLLVGLLLTWVWGFYLWQRRAIRPRPEPAVPPTWPSISIIRPIKGLDTGIEDNLRVAFHSGYAGDREILFVMDDDEEPAYPFVQRAIDEARRTHPEIQARIVLSGQPPAQRTGKLNAMIVGLQAASHELVAFVDSDIREDEHDLRVMVATLLADHQAGAVFPTVISREPPETLGDVGYAVMVNGLYEPAALATAHLLGGELPFIMGHMMVLKREAITAIGGLESAEGQLVDDMFLGKRLRQFGYRNKLSPRPATIIQQGTTTGEFIQILIRWIAFSMTGLPLLTCKLPHWLTGVSFWIGLIVAVLAGVNGSSSLAFLAGFLTLSVGITINDLHYRMAGTRIPLRYAWGSLLIWLASPAIYAQIWIKREVNWRGRVYSLNRAAILQ